MPASFLLPGAFTNTCPLPAGMVQLRGSAPSIAGGIRAWSDRGGATVGAHTVVIRLKANSGNDTTKFIGIEVL